MHYPPNTSYPPSSNNSPTASAYKGFPPTSAQEGMKSYPHPHYGHHHHHPGYPTHPHHPHTGYPTAAAHGPMYGGYVAPGSPHSYTPSPPLDKSHKKNGAPQQGIKKKRKTKKNKIIIPMKDMIRLFSMPQPVAAKKLNVSISTLKRRFYELDISRWPSNHTLQEFNLGEMNAVAMKGLFHRTGAAADLIHSSQSLKQNASYYSLYKEPSADEKKEMGTLLNLYNTVDSKHIDPMTEIILREAFLENTDASESSDEESTSTKSSRK